MVLWARLNTSGLTRVGMQLLKKSLYLWSMFLRDGDTSFRQSQRESQTLNIISHVFGKAQISVDANILQWGKEERKAHVESSCKS